MHTGAWSRINRVITLTRSALKSPRGTTVALAPECTAASRLRQQVGLGEGTVEHAAQRVRPAGQHQR